MIQQTETEVQTGINVVRNMVTDWTSELYGYIFNHLYIVGIIALCLILLFMIHTLKNRIFEKRAKNKEIVSTNEWFSWQEFEAYEKNRKTKT